MSETSASRSQAISPVISVIILSTVVMAVGGAIWAFSQGTMTITAEDYTEAMINMTETISERFIIEHVGYVSGINDLHVWAFNYGDFDIEFKIEAGVGTWPTNNWISLASKEMIPVRLDGFIPDSGVELNIRMYSRRGNDVFYRFIVP